MKRRWIVVPVVVAVVVVAVVAGLYVAHVGPFAESGKTMAPNFTLTSIYGQNFSLSQFRNSSVVVIEFTSLSCSECQIVEQSLKSLYAGYNSSGQSKVQVISVYIEPQYGDTIPALRAYHNQNNITWTMAQDTDGLTVSTAYGITEIPTVFIIDKQGQTVYHQPGPQSTSELQTTIGAAQAGTAKPISFVTVSVFALAAVAGITTFFSPCAFPMFPGYMSLFLGLNVTSAEGQSATGGTYNGAVRKALSAGAVSALGMMIVFLLIGLGLIVAANAVGKYIPFFLVIVGVALVGLGALLLTNLQYWKVVTPFQNLARRLRGTKGDEPVVGTTAYGSRGFYAKLFGYGMGYAAAAAGCVAPVIISAIVAGLALGLLGGLLNILIFSVTAAMLMIVVTLVIALAGKRYVNQLKAYTPVIKKVSAAVLVVVGIYLVYFYYTAWIV